MKSNSQKYHQQDNVKNRIEYIFFSRNLVVTTCYPRHHYRFFMDLTDGSGSDCRQHRRIYAGLIKSRMHAPGKMQILQMTKKNCTHVFSPFSIEGVLHKHLKHFKRQNKEKKVKFKYEPIYYYIYSFTYLQRLWIVKNKYFTLSSLNTR